MLKFELIFRALAYAFIVWGVADMIGIIRYDSDRSTVVAAGIGKTALGLAALWLVGAL